MKQTALRNKKNITSIRSVRLLNKLAEESKIKQNLI